MASERKPEGDSMTISPDTVVLAKGAHASCEDGMCLFEAYNMISRRKHTDSLPPGVSPVLHSMGIALNDRLPDGKRQQLKQYLPRNGSSPLDGTDGDGLEETRGYLALDWLIRTYTPAWLDLAGLTAEATELRDLRRIVDLAAAQAAGPVVRSARTKAAAAGAAAGDANREWQSGTRAEQVVTEADRTAVMKQVRRYLADCRDYAGILRRDLHPTPESCARVTWGPRTVILSCYREATVG